MSQINEKLNRQLKIEKDAFNLYNSFIKKIDGQKLKKNIIKIRDDEKEHIGVVEEMISLVKMHKAEIETVKGFQDFLPPESLKREAVKEIIKKWFGLYGFLPLETTRGDRLFIGLLGADYINLIFVGLSGKLGAALGLQADPLDIKIGKDIQFSNKALKRYQELGRPGYLLETSRLDPGYYLSTVADLN